MYRESKSKLELFYQMFIKCFCHTYSRLEYMFERSLKLPLHIAKRFNAFQVLKWFSLLLEVTCVIFARAKQTQRPTSNSNKAGRKPVRRLANCNGKPGFRCGLKSLCLTRSKHSLTRRKNNPFSKQQTLGTTVAEWLERRI